MSDPKLAIRDKTIFDSPLTKRLIKSFFSLVFKLKGWKVYEGMPNRAGVTIAAPHTSNWDLFYAFGAAMLSDVKIYFSIKESWCTKPIIGKLILKLGAIPIDRSSGSGGQVDKIKAFVEKHKNKRIFFLVTPEGTRGLAKRWKTGFYHLAHSCNLPIFLAKVDFRTKEAGVFHTFTLTDNKEKDIATIQESYKSVCGKYPEKQFPPYTGPVPEFSAMEARVIQALHTLKGNATKAEIAAKTRLDELTTEMLSFLVEKGILERCTDNPEGKATKYRLTTAGNAFLFHLQPA